MEGKLSYENWLKKYFTVFDDKTWVCEEGNHWGVHNLEHEYKLYAEGSSFFCQGEYDE